MTATATPLHQRFSSARPTVERIIERDVAVPVLDLTPVLPELLRDITRALAARNQLALMHTIGRTSILNDEHQDAMSAILATLHTAAAAQVVLSPAQCEAIAEECDAASTDPEPCRRDGCEYLVDPQVSKQDLCPWHEQAVWK